MPRQIDDTGFGNIKIIQDSRFFRYGIDAVLLAAFAAETSRKGFFAADLGTGNGIVPLILSHKTKAKSITGFEIQKECAELATENVIENGLEERINIKNLDVRNILEEDSLRNSMEIVTSNPPYKKADSGVVSENRALALARHEIEGTLEDFIKAAVFLLKDKGEFYMVHRPERIADICQLTRKHRLEPKEIVFVLPYPNAAPNIMLVKCIKNGGEELKIRKNLCVRTEDGEYSSAIREIYEKSLLNYYS